MHRIFPALIAILLTIGLMAPVQAQDRGEAVSDVTCQPYAVATAPQIAGEPLTVEEIVLTSLTGEELGRVAADEPMRVFPTSYPDRALVRQLDGVFSLLIMDGGEPVSVLPLPELFEVSSIQHDSPAFIVPDGSRYAVLSGVIDLDAYLVDLETGKVLVLSDHIDEPGIIIGGSVSPGDAWAAIWTGSDVVLFDLETDQPPLLLNNDDVLGAPWFSDDGSTLYFTRGEERNESVIVAHDLATGMETPLTEEDAWFGLQHFPGGVLLAQTPDSVNLIPLDGSGAVELMQSTTELRTRVINHDNTKVLVEIVERNGGSWVLLDLAGGGATPLPELDEAFLTVPIRQANWVTLAPQPTPGVAVEGARYHTVDLETGEVHVALEQTGDGVYMPLSIPSNDGRYYTIVATSTEVSNFWLIDAQLGESELIAQSPGGTSGAMTPDGCYLAVGIFDTLGEGRQGMVQIIDIETREVIVEIEESILLGWARM